ncbi:hypothetical protein DVU_0615 [Nitratidesulfovibrio vulgaris str. Hildenborough]|uniref:Uncharacterized protein n=1 Tax=Nitratidesulfovibrio vulgaris (strain ATCC 29579 / DSM 644 / CCUG 34227 / NCIMB 8303 / VKM B-1760 / Hildenborough) TaxID=882 RepID=Q72EG3_NITV2|nr:hypothetical protein DVU_0615 [Nitratidesulfovibrio vulgaris str. Hildenborough]
MRFSRNGKLVRRWRCLHKSAKYISFREKATVVGHKSENGFVFLVKDSYFRLLYR